MSDETPPAITEVPGSCLCFHLRAAARRVTRAYDRALQPVGLRITQFTVLVAIANLGSVPVSRLAEAVGLERTSLTRNLRPLEKQGLVRSAPTDDPRERSLSVTDAGRARLEAALPHWRAAQEAMRDELGGAAAMAELQTALKPMIPRLER